MQNTSMWAVPITTVANQSSRVSADADGDEDDDEEVPHVVLAFFHAIEHAEEAAEELEFPHERAIAWAAIASAYARLMV